MAKGKGNGAGRPQVFDRPAVLGRLVIEMAKGDRPLELICKDEGMPTPESIYLWISEDTEESRQLFKIFSRAQELWCWAQREIIIKIADDQSRDIIENEIETDSGAVRIERRSDNTAVNRDKLRVGARQWAMAKLTPKLFGDKITQEHTGEGGGPVQFSKVVDKPPTETPEQWQARVERQMADRQAKKSQK